MFNYLGWGVSQQVSMVDVPVEDEIVESVERFINSRPCLGYVTREEFVRAALRHQFLNSSSRDKL